MSPMQWLGRQEVQWGQHSNMSCKPEGRQERSTGFPRSVPKAPLMLDVLPGRKGSLGSHSIILLCVLVRKSHLQKTSVFCLGAVDLRLTPARGMGSRSLLAAKDRQKRAVFLKIRCFPERRGSRLSYCQ